MAILKKPYEISIWDNELNSSGYYTERRIAVIGTDQMTSPNRAFAPVFTKNVNGEKTFSFSMAYQYYDISSDKIVQNPLIGYLINERKVKLHYDGEWYDFLITNHEENSDSDTWTFSCVDAFVNELAKTGYNVEFSTDLNNNQGTAVELGKKTLKNTDWEVDEANCDTLVQKVNEPMIKASVTNGSFSVLDVEGGQTVTISNGEEIYIFYSYIINKDVEFVQFMRKRDEAKFTKDDNTVINGPNYRIEQDVSYNIDGNTKTIAIGNATITLSTHTVGSDTVYDYVDNQGYRFVYGPLTTYDPVMERTVDIYTATKQGQSVEIYKYSDSTYTTSNVITSYVTNGSNFNVYEDGSLQGWSNATLSSTKEDGVSKFQPMRLTTYPEVAPHVTLANLTDFTTVEGFLELKFDGTLHQNTDDDSPFKGAYENTYFNSGFNDHASVVDHISCGQRYMLRLAFATSDECHGTLVPYNSLNSPHLRAIVARYTTTAESDDTTHAKINVRSFKDSDIIMKFEGSFIQDDTVVNTGNFRTDSDTHKTVYIIEGAVQTPSTNCIYKDKDTNETKYWSSSTQEYVSSNSSFIHYYSTVAQALQSISNKDMVSSTTQVGIFLYVDGAGLVDRYIYLSDIQITKYVEDANGHLSIGNVPEATTITTDNFYLKPAENAKKASVEIYYDLSHLASAEGLTNIQQKYNNKCEKILSISESQSNCFNILQSICETFECWLKIIVGRNDDTGAINVDSNGKPIKKVAFKAYAGKDNFAGFKYGINLKSIQRVLNSDEIVTKLIVENVQNEYLDSGTMSIRDAKINPSGEAYILNFNYYLQKGLITNPDKCQDDLKAYYEGLKTLNNRIAAEEAVRNALELACTKVDSLRNVYAELIESAKEKNNKALEKFEASTGMKYNRYVNGRETVDLLTENEEEVVEEGLGVRELGYCFYNLENYKAIVKCVKLEQELTEEQIENGDEPEPEYYQYILYHWNSEEATPYWEELYNNGSATVNGAPPDGESEIYAMWMLARDNAKTADYGVKGLQGGDLTESEEILDIIGEIYVTSATINNYAGILSNTVGEYEGLRLNLEGAKDYTVTLSEVRTETGHSTRINFSDYIPGIKFKVFNGDNVLEFETSVSQKSFEAFDETVTYNKITFIELPQHYSVSGGSGPIDIPNGIKTVTLVADQSYKNKYPGCISVINAKQAEKDNLEKIFNSRYASFIKEGTWSSNDYIDPNLYYLDAMQAESISAMPKVEYTIEVAEVSELQGLENYIFDVGEKTYIEDTEFFGWDTTSDIRTPIKEEVIVSQVEWHLDEPDTNTITIQNYKTRFEDLFQRISATVQTVQYNEAAYAKTNSILSGGALGKDLLLDSLNNISSESYILTSDGSITIDKDCITVRNLTNASNVLKINNEGIKISSDGGLSWSTAIDGNGINASIMMAGTINTSEITILDDGNPSFRWDKYGISAYRKSSPDGAYDLSTFVRFDQYGLYGVKNSIQYSFDSLEEIKEKAHFGITWDGFFIKNSYTNGYVSISSDNDFEVIQNVRDTATQLVTPITRIQIGAIEKDGFNNPTQYGIRIKNQLGQDVLVTGDDGNLTATGTINAKAGAFTGLITVGDTTQDPLLNPWIIISGGVEDAAAEAAGSKAIIKTSNYQDGAGYGWKIDSEGDAVFNNITARGAIKTAVFEYAEIQAVGGIFIFRPSSTIKSARKDGNNLIVKVEKSHLFTKTSNQEYSWCKISNYTSDGTEPNAENVLATNGLTHVYQIGDVNTTTGEITLLGAAASDGFINGVKHAFNDSESDVLASLEGGALIDMGREDRSSNYGIGVNSSDNTVNLPRRALTLFETVIDKTRNPKVSYEYRCILGTLPELTAGQAHSTYYGQYMAGTQGIYTDNMYIGDANNYLAFYTTKETNQQGEEVEKKHLRISAEDLIFGYDPETGDPITISDEVAPGLDALQVQVFSTFGERIINNNGAGYIYARVTRGNTGIDSLPPSSQLAQSDTAPSGSEALPGMQGCIVKNGNTVLYYYRNDHDVWTQRTSTVASYKWSFKDKNGNTLTGNETGLSTYLKYIIQNNVNTQFVYLDGGMIDTRIIADVEVTVD